MKNENKCNLTLLKILIDILIFLDKADESIINADIAVEIMEQTSSTLMNLDSGEISILKEKLTLLSEQYSGEDQKFVKEFYDNFIS